MNCVLDYGPNFCHSRLQCCGATCSADCGGTGTGGYCTLPCSGVAPDEQVAADCSGFTNQSDCTNYESAQFPYRCMWQVGRPQPCLAP